MLKQAELATPTSCLNKAAPDEPVFVLRAKDPFAAQAVRLWAAMAEGTHEPDKVHEALKLAETMEEWREARMPKEVGHSNVGFAVASHTPHTTPRR